MSAGGTALFIFLTHGGQPFQSFPFHPDRHSECSDRKLKPLSLSWTSRTATGFLVTALVAGSILRLNGIDWGTDPDTGEFHAFHPDESTIVRNSRWVGTDLRQIQMPYGFFPAYLLWGVSSLAGVSLSPESNSGLREAHILARSISAAMSVASIWVLFLIARTLGGGLTAAISAVLLAFCFGHVQQAHYYTVDPLLTGIVVLCLCLILRMPQAGPAAYAAAGALVGTAVGTRLVGVLLPCPLSPSTPAPRLVPEARLPPARPGIGPHGCFSRGSRRRGHRLRALLRSGTGPVLR